MRMLWQCGISRVVAKSRYRDLDEILAMTDLAIDIRSDEGYIDLIYKGRTGT
jgi:hypothetical protein